MIVLHGSWRRKNSGHGGRFLLWAETDPQATPSRRGRAPRLSPQRPRPHPGQVSARQVRVAWQHLAPQVRLPAAGEQAVVWLPSSQGAPLPPPEIRAVAGEPEADDATLAAWEVEAVAVPAEQALRLLAVTPGMAAQVWSEVVLGSDLGYWSHAAKLALELLARQQYLPAIVPGEAGSYGASWAPHLGDPGDQERVALLARAMPPACRAIAGPPGAGRRMRLPPTGLPAPAILLESFLGSAVDGAVRRWGAPASRRGGLSHGPALEWRHLLLHRPGPRGELPTFMATGRSLRPLYEQYRSWIGQLASAGEGAFRLCFRLEAPAGDQPSDAWTLRYLLQAADDPSLLVPADAVWREAGSELHYLNRRLEQPQERLLAGLGRASRLFPALENSLQTARPAECALTTAEAYAFLREAAPLMESAGFGLLVPPWWKRRGSRVGLRLHLSPVQATPAGLLGLETLVNFDWQLSLNGEVLSKEEFLQLADLKVPLVRVRGEWVELRPAQVERMLHFWQEQAHTQEGTLADALRLAQAAGQDDGEATLPLSEVTAAGWVEEVLQQLSGQAALSLLPAPERFRGQLRPYQVTGVSWLAFLRRWGLGACLADDMGLGKTIQVLALLLGDREEGRLQRPSLLICPTSAVGNWQREVTRFAPDLRVLLHYGPERQGGAEFAAEAARHDLVISTYSLLYRDEPTLASLAWGGVILDEAQNIKNASTRQAQAARRLRAANRIALTGTPVENRLAELWSIIDFLNPGYLGSQAEYRRRFGLPIERYQDPAALRRLRSLVRPFILRRLKSDPQVIQDLPEKLEMPVYCKLRPEQATLYQAVVSDALQKIAEADGVQRRGLVLAMLLKLKQICNHPAQFLGDGSSLPGRSGKLARLTEMLDEVVATGDRALVFTQFAEMGQLLRQHLQSELHRETLFLHGAVPQKQRERMIARFQEDAQGPPVFILSLKAGGTALNLMRANHVFHFDRWWNPAVENQATDRAFRIGQTRNVQVHKFICLGTLEERIAELIESKKALAENVIESGEAWLTELSTDQLREILVLREDAVEGET